MASFAWELYNVFKDFFNRTNAWLMELPVYIQPATNDYVIDTCQNAIVARLMGIGRPDDATAYMNYIAQCPPQYLQTYSMGGTEAMNPLLRSSRDAVLLSAGTKCPVLRIRSNPQANEVWIAMLALNVTDPMDKDGLPDAVPEWLIEKYYLTICDGLISKLMLQAGKPYSSPQGAEFHGKKFNQGVSTARDEVRKMFVYGAQRFQFPGGCGLRDLLQKVWVMNYISSNYNNATYFYPR